MFSRIGFFNITISHIHYTNSMLGATCKTILQQSKYVYACLALVSFFLV